MPKIDTTALVRRAVEAIWNQGDLAVADILFADDYINHAGLITNLVRGPEAIKVSVALYRTAFPDLQIMIDALTARRNAVLVRWTARSPVHHGTLTGILVCRIADSQIAESWTQWDHAGALGPLGLRPAGRT
ncbi:SnoaL-like domain-containing protein [Chloroflexales bacterium ZM16-3]|nr:SnoaL-like domain-containing protein [Chloroflexales bacterium ZM16-3]